MKFADFPKIIVNLFDFDHGLYLSLVSYSFIF